MKARLLVFILVAAVIGGSIAYFAPRFAALTSEQTLEKADWYLRRGSFAKSTAILRDLLQQKPDFAEAHLKLAQVLLNQPVWLLNALEREKIKSTDDKESDAILAKIHEFYDLAADAYYAALKVDPLIVTRRPFSEFINAVPANDAIVLWLKQADARPAESVLARHLAAMHLAGALKQVNRRTFGDGFSEKLDKSAEAYFEKVVAAEPNFTAARLSLAQVHFNNGQVDAGFADLQKAAEELKSTEIRLYVARQMARLGRIQAVTPYINAVLEESPENDQAKLLRASVLFEQGDYAKTAELLAQIPEINRHNPAYLLMSGYLDLQNSEFEEAEAALSVANAQQPRHPVIEYLRGLAKLRTQSWVKADVLLNNATAVFPQAHLARAVLALQQTEPKQAIEACRPALLYDENDADAWRLLAAANIIAGDAAGAKQALDRVLALRPDSAIAKQALAGVSMAIAADAENRIERFQQIAAEYEYPAVRTLAATLSGRADAGAGANGQTLVAQVYFLLLRGNDYARIAADMLQTGTAAPSTLSLLERELTRYANEATDPADYGSRTKMAALAHRQPNVLIPLNHAVIANRLVVAATCAEKMLDLEYLWKNRLMTALDGHAIDWPY